MLICMFCIYPVASFIPGNDHGCYETLTGATEILFSSRSIMAVTAVYFTCVFTFNAIGIFITKILDALWKALVGSSSDGAARPPPTPPPSPLQRLTLARFSLGRQLPAHHSVGRRFAPFLHDQSVDRRALDSGDFFLEVQNQLQP